MIIIKLPTNNIPERKYIIDVIFNEFLGLHYKIEIENIKNYEILLENGKKLIFEDSFFNKFKKDLDYLKLKNISEKITYSKKENNIFLVEDNLPIIYGKNRILMNKNEIICGIDIFASSFFMLTRWEEYVNKVRDKHNRFPSYASLAYKYNFLDRPVVNEYVEMLWNMLKFLGINQERKKREFELVLTHDVDFVYKYASLKSGLREIIGDIVKRKNIKLAYSNIINKLKFHLDLIKDPFDTFDYLMDISEKNNTKSYFFLHSSTASKYDIDNNKFLKKIADKIQNRGHFLGYHPSYNSYNNEGLFRKDKEKIEKIINQELKFGRQHFLRFEVPTTWQIWEDNNMEWDSTLSYADKEGFRCGVCYPSSVFNILSRKKLKLKEKPLIIMEGSFTTYQQNITPQKMEQKIFELINKVRKYNGEFVFLWHNSSFNTLNWLKFQYIYEKVLKK
ncbi:polysaccharide deacetylase family protein [Nitrosophilus kaiyonis]|uniref:polysaccharide deacetylase family protein n=1 Tax=Nitrosophilus kaiyonis TaxID=2930200 RepID=UPI002491E494|nr:polysaccharide deacetylase family protein [Nitrosophilus kaiyonis]